MRLSTDIGAVWFEGSVGSGYLTVAPASRSDQDIVEVLFESQKLGKVLFHRLVSPLGAAGEGTPRVERIDENSVRVEYFRGLPFEIRAFSGRSGSTKLNLSFGSFVRQLRYELSRLDSAIELAARKRRGVG